MNNKEAIETLETMCAEPEDGQEARLSADELDAVLYAVNYMKGGNRKCMNCNTYPLPNSNFCPICGALMATNSTIDIGGRDNEN